GGTIKFYEGGVNPDSSTPLVQIDFDNAQLNPGSFYGDNLFQFNNVDITVDGYSGVLSQEQFSFAFANKVFIYPLNPGGSLGVLMAPVEPIGFTATASFTSSAVPEPITLGLLGLGSLGLLRRRRI
ncbi:MAG: PEP-CTERM sorting domain-containing protein, partial [Planctomycetes bacterium]|nr:PEP-CTERM sorting domain-containing protein [Planctomycetota bacterium]